MTTVVLVKGNVQHTITLDPSIWIFDDRRIDLDTFFTEDYVERNDIEEYKRAAGKHWSREIMEGATYPPTLQTEREFEEKQDVSGTFGIYLHHFLKNATPKEDATTIIFQTADGTKHPFPLKQLDELILKYSEDGKPLRETGPIHVLLKDGSNKDTPIQNVTMIEIE